MKRDLVELVNSARFGIIRRAREAACETAEGPLGEGRCPQHVAPGAAGVCLQAPDCSDPAARGAPQNKESEEHRWLLVMITVVNPPLNDHTVPATAASLILMFTSP